jgi:hypothetical protein
MYRAVAEKFAAHNTPADQGNCTIHEQQAATASSQPPLVQQEDHALTFSEPGLRGGLRV